MAAIQLLDPSTLQFNTQDKLYHDGIELEKGVVITPSFLERNEDLMAESVQLFTVYPDIFLDLITPVDSNFTLFPYQRLFLRACMRYTNIYITAARATSKTYRWIKRRSCVRFLSKSTIAFAQVIKMLINLCPLTIKS